MDNFITHTFPYQWTCCKQTLNVAQVSEEPCILPLAYAAYTHRISNSKQEGKIREDSPFSMMWSYTLCDLTFLWQGSLWVQLIAKWAEELFWSTYFSLNTGD